MYLRELYRLAFLYLLQILGYAIGLEKTMASHAVPTMPTSRIPSGSAPTSLYPKPVGDQRRYRFMATTSTNDTFCRTIRALLPVQGPRRGVVPVDLIIGD